MPENNKEKKQPTTAEIIKSLGLSLISAKQKDTEALADNLTQEQRNRDESTTKLYDMFIESYNEKQDFISKYKKRIAFWCLVWICTLVLSCLACVVAAIISAFSAISGIGEIITLIAALIPLATAIVGTLNIVVKHVFPEDEERYITEIVKLIHENDLHNKQENMKLRDSASVEPRLP